MSVHLNGDFFWEKKEGEFFFIGLTQLGVEHCGSIQGVDIQFQQDEVFSRGDILFTIEGIHHSLEFNAFTDGKIAEVNLITQDEPEVISEDPLEEGWVISFEKTV